jgi:predicted ArsR family transcriptional regulator
MTNPPELPQPLRVRVLDALQQIPGATADELVARLDIDGQSIPRQVRRSLAELETAGLAHWEPADYRQPARGRRPRRWTAG